MRTTIASGVESDLPSTTEKKDVADGIFHSFTLPSQHLRLTQVIFSDVTDYHNELVQERQWLLHPSEKRLFLSGNLFVIEDLQQGTGKILVKRAPLPHARPKALAGDLKVAPAQGKGFEFCLTADDADDAGAWTVLDYHGDRVERARVIQEWQRGLRPSGMGHGIPRLLTNTWGDRSRDSRMRESFIRSEIDAAHRLGADVVQLDDGWQRGVTSNSARAKELGGVWEGFWNADPEFWEPHPERLPEGLRPVAEYAQSRNVKLGLWFAPDSWNEFANWRKDAECVLDLFTTLGVEHFKIDGVMTPTETSLRNLLSFFKTVLEDSHGQVVFDLDITAGVRPGYFGAIEAGPLFVENRYTDWHNYWPHQTLRNLWKLSRWIDPLRLRMEFLNNRRNPEQYAEDPLAPSLYDPACLFATVMFSNPLGWFEVSNLQESCLESVSRLVTKWKSHREAIFGGTILPIGEAPDGYSYTGFMSLAEARDSGYLLIFRERHPNDQETIKLPDIGVSGCKIEILAGEGSVAFIKNNLQVRIPEQLDFVFARWG